MSWRQVEWRNEETGRYYFRLRDKLWCFNPDTGHSQEAGDQVWYPRPNYSYGVFSLVHAQGDRLYVTSGQELTTLNFSTGFSLITPVEEQQMHLDFENTMRLRKLRALLPHEEPPL